MTAGLPVRLRAPAGYSLIEVALAVVVLGLIVLGALVIYGSVVQEKKVLMTAADISAIRVAVGGRDEDAPLQWDRLQKLPPRLQDAAATDGDATLDGANPWGGDYALREVAGNEGAWVLEVGAVPAKLWEDLGQQIRNLDRDLDRNPPGCAEGNFCVGFDDRP